MTERGHIFSWAIFTLFAWLVPHVSIEIGEFYRALRKSPDWTGDRLAEGFKSIRTASIQAISRAMILITFSAALISTPTLQLDSRMVAIIYGLSHILGAVVVFEMSYKFPEWLEVYDVHKRKDVKNVRKNLKALEFRVRACIFWQFAQMYFMLLPYFCGMRRGSGAISGLAGIAFGFLIDVCVYVGKRKFEEEGRKKLMFLAAMIFVALLICAFLFSSGLYYIDTVWGIDTSKFYVHLDLGRNLGFRVDSFITTFVVGVVLHFLLWWFTVMQMARKEKELEVERKGKDRPNYEKSKSRKYKPAMASGVFRAFKIMDFTSYKNLPSMTEEPPSKVVKTAGKGGKAESAPEGEQKRESAVRFANDSKDNAPAAAEKKGSAIRFADDTKDATPAASPSEIDDDDDDEIDEKSVRFVKQLECEPDISKYKLFKMWWWGQFSDESETFNQPPEKRAFSEVPFAAFLSLCSIFFVVVNIGATRQQIVVKQKLPAVQDALYVHINQGPVCAWNDKGPKSNITTFESVKAAKKARFKVVHCGACGSCSSYSNLRQQYRTRTFLAAASAKCGRMSLYKGRQGVVDCLKAHPIYWDEDCAQCWTDDILCAKSHCAFNFLQSFFINSVADFAVGPEHVTAASCEEANCEVDLFVPCSGATRRRMNINSSIKRPGTQLCGNVDMDWEKVFGESEQCDDDQYGVCPTEDWNDQ